MKKYYFRGFDSLMAQRANPDVEELEDLNGPLFTQEQIDRYKREYIRKNGPFGQFAGMDKDGPL